MNNPTAAVALAEALFDSRFNSKEKQVLLALLKRLANSNK